MKQRAQIIASFFLVIYASFLLHNLFAHSHVHEQDMHGHCHFIGENHESNHIDLSSSSESGHVDDNCSLCENDGKMHRHVVFIRTANPDQNALAPQQEKLDLCVFHESGKIIFVPVEPNKKHAPLTPSLRAPPVIS